ncbi:4Fe-4S binding protein [Brucepastera parasyntrophica]|uniref:[Fe-Fe] hydrogenase large subunit C-terminal domain-containing protein n=1 Tax=Brucepastera parasyntrophica TaxID=2880008 RepID=UPI00210EF42E|nr:[Fe-Fe] hydrogenase large subunit C-terminal domain-containing protein [Brucepastera parasyntrophica]ULQ59150.1 4Fe-4S binding protein [Brucepastera parasyntrophica]
MGTKAESTSLIPVINIDSEKCVNCHTCISVCPVKYCIDGSGEKVTINHDLCIGCGNCIEACTHDARSILDDTEEFLDALAQKEPLIAIAAPAIVASFPGQYKRLLGWLKKQGVEACFDVSFGAELTIKSYLEYIKQIDPKMVISQPCPAIVTYIELYQPELLPYLIPMDSPMLHTIKMIKAFYPQYSKHRIVALSPCVAKRREFSETGVDVLNVTYKSLDSLLKLRNVNLASEPEAEFDNPEAERAALFSIPGGLMRTAMRDLPGIDSRTRKIEGTDIIYKYFEGLPKSVKENINPLLIDCLNCELGCNGGPGTLKEGKSADELEYPVEKVSLEHEKHYGGAKMSREKAHKKMGKVLSEYWRPNLYRRNYVNRSGNYMLKQPTDSQISQIYQTMLKTKKRMNLTARPADTEAAGVWRLPFLTD